MRFLADENCDFIVVRMLRAAGHDVVAVSEITPRADDPDVISLAVREKRIMLTEDKDFGQLVIAHGQTTSGVIFLRFPLGAKTNPREYVRLVGERGEKLAGSFATIQPGRIRISKITGG